MKVERLTNLWYETEETLARLNLSYDKDVLQVQTDDGYIDKELFKKKAMNTLYNAESGASGIRDDLILVGDGWWLERYQDHGAEWWTFNAMPTLTNNNAGSPDLTNGLED